MFFKVPDFSQNLDSDIQAHDMSQSETNWLLKFHIVLTFNTEVDLYWKSSCQQICVTLFYIPGHQWLFYSFSSSIYFSVYLIDAVHIVVKWLLVVQQTWVDVLTTNTDISICIDQDVSWFYPCWKVMMWAFSVNVQSFK